MRTTFELAGFAVVAVGLHLSFVAVREDAGFQGTGDDGLDLISVAAADASIEAMVQQWETPPAVPKSEPVALQAPEMPAVSAPEQMQPLVSESLALPELAQRPEAPSLPMPPVEPEPQPEDPPKPPEPPAAPSTPPEVEAPPPAPPEPAPAPPTPEPKKEEPPKVVEKASTASAQSTARVAQGSGGGEVRGDSGPSDTATVSDAKAKSLMAQWGSQIRNRIARKVPRGAGKGTANVRITVSADGRLVQASLAKSSGNQEIDKLALTAVQKAGKFPAAPRGLGGANRNFVLPISAR